MNSACYLWIGIGSMVSNLYMEKALNADGETVKGYFKVVSPLLVATVPVLPLLVPVHL